MKTIRLFIPLIALLAGMICYSSEESYSVTSSPEEATVVSSTTASVNWKVDVVPYGIPRKNFETAVSEAISAWTVHATITGYEAVVTITTIDFSKNGLDPRWYAVAKDGTSIFLNSRYRWGLFTGYKAGYVDAKRVLMHEWGHMFRLNHAPLGVKAIMAPDYRRDIWTLQAWDIAAIKEVWK